MTAAALRPGTRLAGRYEVCAKLGAGGMGVVYEVVDLASTEHVALKTLRGDVADAQAIKREFRALADIAHPNLVQLYDLFDADGLLCLTMELVAGVDLMTELRGSELAVQTATIAGTLARGAHADDTMPGPIGARAGERAFWPPPDLGRVRDRFAQLARALRALHARGVVHRDIKPHNVRVTPEGRVVLLDFGLATTTGATGALAGTLAYMAPEQTEGARVAPEADWYSYGILLHEVLTGSPPWTGEPATILRHKRMEDPPQLRTRGELPADLAALADDLITRDPARRPAGIAVLERLGQRRWPRAPATLLDGNADHTIPEPCAVGDSATMVAGIEPPGNAAEASVMIGRAAELGQLRAAWQRVAAGDRAWVVIEGPSGLGKTLLLSAFEHDVASQHGDVLHGRCYEREAIAYKGIDQIVEALVARLCERGEPRSRDAALLAHAFPAAGVLADGEAPAWHGLDHRGAALRALLAQLALAGPVLVALDDIQWADPDCLGVLAHALAPPGIAGVMTVVTARPEPSAGWLELPMAFARIRLSALVERDAVELAQRLLGRAAVAVDGVALARASNGHPLELLERVRAVHAGASSHGAARDLLVQRVANAPPEVRLLVELVATAGAPVPVAAMAPAMAVGETAVRAAIDRAQLAGLVRGRRAAGRAIVEAAHDQVREVVFAALAPADRAAHAARLAPVLERHGHEPAQVAALYLLAGRPDHARRCARHAAERMTELGGHATAAALWRQVAELSIGDVARVALQHAADALALAGRGAEAAALYRRLADSARDDGDRLRLLRRGAEELLRSGRIAEGLAVVESSLPELRDPSTPASAYVRALALHAQTIARVRWHERLRIASRRLAPVDRFVAAAARDREVLDLQWAAIAGHTLGSPGHFIFAVERHLRAALRSGDPEHISLAWSAEATLATFLGDDRLAEAGLHLAAAALAGDTTAEPGRARAVATATAALIQLCAGMWSRADAVASEATSIFERLPWLVWERNTCSVILTCARVHTGDLARLAAAVRRERDRIAASGDLYAHEIAHSGFAVMTDLLAGDAARASAALEQVGDRPTGIMTAWQRAIAHALVGAYGDRASWHRARAESLLRGPLALGLLRSPLVLGTLLWTRASLELAVGDPRVAATLVGRLRRLPMRGMTGIAELFAGHAAHLAGDRERARVCGAAAELTLRADEMPMFAASARWLRDPDSWPAWRDALAKAGAVAPARLARIYAPALGLPDACDVSQ